MSESTRILTTHVGSLRHPQKVVIDRHINTIRAANFTAEFLSPAVFRQAAQQQRDRDQEDR
jgi:hypothetical protein